MENTAGCPGCRLKFHNHLIASFGSSNASGEYNEKHSELSNHTVSKQDLDFIHQHVMDAYSEQHSGNGMIMANEMYHP